jgi:hypothetical protein
VYSALLSQNTRLPLVQSMSGKEEEKGTEVDLLEFKDFDEFEDHASDLPQSDACGGFIYVGYVSILCTLIRIM